MDSVKMSSVCDYFLLDYTELILAKMFKIFLLFYFRFSYIIIRIQRISYKSTINHQYSKFHKKYPTMFYISRANLCINRITYYYFGLLLKHKIILILFTLNVFRRWPRLMKFRRFDNFRKIVKKKSKKSTY